MSCSFPPYVIIRRFFLETFKICLKLVSISCVQILLQMTLTTVLQAADSDRRHPGAQVPEVLDPAVRL